MARPQRTARRAGAQGAKALVIAGALAASFAGWGLLAAKESPQPLVPEPAQAGASVAVAPLPAWMASPPPIPTLPPAVTALPAPAAPAPAAPRPVAPQPAAAAPVAAPAPPLRVVTAPRPAPQAPITTTRSSR